MMKILIGGMVSLGKMSDETREKISEALNKKHTSKSRSLVLKRAMNRKNILALHDAETGQLLAGQLSCEIVNNPDDAKVCVFKTEREITTHEIKEIQAQLSGFTGLKFVVLNKDIDSLQTLNDEDLKAIGLVRISKIVIEYPGVSELDLSNTYPLPKGERVINLPDSSSILKQYLDGQ